MRNADLYAQYDRECLEATAQADRIEERLAEMACDDEPSDSYLTHLETRRDWNYYLAQQAREKAEYFGGAA